MMSFDYLLLIAALLVVVYQISLALRAKRSVVIAGAAPNQTIMIAIIGVVLVIALIRTDDILQRGPTLAAVALACLSIFLTKPGLSKTGMYAGGRYIPFDKAESYEFEKRPDGTQLFKLAKATRECMMIITKDQVKTIEAMMEEYQIPTADEFHKRLSDRAKTRVDARQNQKKKKKKK